MADINTPVLRKAISLNVNQEEYIDGMTREFPYACRYEDLSQVIIPWHWHEELEIAYITKGTLTLMTSENRYEIGPDEGYFVNTNVICCGERQSDALSVVHQFHAELLGGFFKSVYWTKYIDPVLKNRTVEILKFSNDTECGTEILKRLKMLNEVQALPNHEMQIRNLLSEIWLLIIRFIDETAAQRPKVNMHRQDRMRHMLKFIHKHYGEDISLKDIADSAAVSERECLRCFNEDIGRTPFQYVQSYRLHKSRELLQASDKSITDIALECGFSSSAYFGKLFRDAYNMTPREYRKERKEQTQK